MRWAIFCLRLCGQATPIDCSYGGCFEGGDLQSFLSRLPHPYGSVTLKTVMFALLKWNGDQCILHYQGLMLHSLQVLSSSLSVLCVELIPACTAWVPRT